MIAEAITIIKRKELKMEDKIIIYGKNG